MQLVIRNYQNQLLGCRADKFKGHPCLHESWSTPFAQSSARSTLGEFRGFGRVSVQNEEERYHVNRDLL